MSPAPEIPPTLILRARSGDAVAFGKLVEALAGLAFNVAWRMTRNRPDAEDMSQEVFLRLHRHFATYDPRLPFLPWFRRLTTNACLNWCRTHRARRPQRLEDDTASAPPKEPSEDLRDAVLALPDEQRLAITHFYFGDLSVVEIAEAMDVPTGTVKTWLYRAREALKSKLQILKPDGAGEGIRP
ncbi:MAG TPA: RNA polymerase sigma factor [Planctomycetota bacterium]|nr:RNA polymerase sigma factor [Planctomycetota bacterium]